MVCVDRSWGKLNALWGEKKKIAQATEKEPAATCVVGENTCPHPQQDICAGGLVI